MNYKRKSRFFGIFILKIKKFRQKFEVVTLRENGSSNNRFFANSKF